MPALRLLGRKWSAATDDLVFPGVFELSFRVLWLGLTIAALVRYYPDTWHDCTRGGDLVRAYLVAQAVLLGAVVIVTVLLVNRSAQGAVMDTSKRRHVPALLLAKVGLVVPEVVLNCLGTAWTFGSADITGIECTKAESFSKTVVEALVIFDWVLFGLTVFGLAMVFDPMGSRRYQDPQATPGECLRHRKTTSLWTRRFRWLFCWMRSDEYGHEAFEQVAGLLSALFRSTDLVPSDLVAGCVLLRVKQKREVRERRRIQMLTNDEPKFSTDLKRIFSTCPSWMNLRDALHFLRLSMAAYGWPFVLYRYPITGAARLAPRLTCCACFRRKAAEILDDNCCFCHLAGVKYWSKVQQEDVLFASFRNHIFEMPFCVIADHSTRSIVIAVRGSISLRDIFTDLVAVSEPFEAPGLPSGTQAHKGMLQGARFISALLQRHQVLERAFARYPSYQLVLTGHSLGASVASLLGIMLRGVFPTLRVYSFSCPAGTLSREAARLTETFIFTVGVGDDFVMRLGVHSIENLRTALIQTLHATRLPKYRIVWNGFGYALFGVPSADLETTWKDETEAGNTSGESPLLEEQTPPLQTIAAVTEANIFSRDINMRRISKTRLYNSGRILYIVHRKKTKAERKAGTGGPSYELRWAQAEDFLELRVMPRMMLDHFPENVYATINTVLQELGDEPSEI